MKNNKILIILGIVLAVILIIICSMIGTDSNNTKTDKATEDGQTIVTNAQKESETVKDDEKKEFTQINVDKYLEYYAGEENKIVLVARPTCHYCQIAEPILQNISFKYNIEIKTPWNFYKVFLNYFCNMIVILKFMCYAYIRNKK